MPTARNKERIATGARKARRRAERNALLRLLLRHAVESAEAKDQVAAGDAYDFAPWKKPGECVERDAIVGIVECGHDHDIIRDVEIRVAGGQAKVRRIRSAPASEASRFETVCHPGPSLSAADRDFPEARRSSRRICFSLQSTTIVVGSTKRARSSTCPWVSSPAMPLRNHSTCVTPR